MPAVAAVHKLLSQVNLRYEDATERILMREHMTWLSIARSGVHEMHPQITFLAVG